MTDQDSLPVRLKGVGDSLWVTIDPTLPVEKLKTELIKPFQQLQHLAVNARVILDPGKDDTDEKLVEELGRFLQQQFQVGQVTSPAPEKSPEVSRAREKDLGSAWHSHRSEALIITGRVRSGQKIQAKNHLIIMGDLNPGAEAIAGGDIIVLGTLLGNAAAGQPDNEDAMILAMDFRPTQVQIGGFVAAGGAAAKAENMEFARIENNEIVVMDYIKENPFKRLAWPEVR